MKNPAQFTPARHNLQACLEALDAHWQRSEPGADYAARLLWLIRATERAWREASAAGPDGMAGLEFPGLSGKLSATLFLGGLLAMASAAMALAELRVMPSEARELKEAGEAAGNE